MFTRLQALRNPHLLDVYGCLLSRHDWWTHWPLPIELDLLPLSSKRSRGGPGNSSLDSLWFPWQPAPTLLPFLKSHLITITRDTLSLTTLRKSQCLEEMRQELDKEQICMGNIFWSSGWPNVYTFYKLQYFNLFFLPSFFPPYLINHCIL